MYTPAPYERGRKRLYNFRLDSFKKQLVDRWDGPIHVFQVQALWFSSSATTLGSLVYGVVYFEVPEKIAGPVYEMDFEQFTRAAYEPKAGPLAYNLRIMDVSYVVLSKEKLWTAGGEGILDDTVAAIGLHTALQDNPTGDLGPEWSGWLLFTNKQG